MPVASNNLIDRNPATRAICPLRLSRVQSSARIIMLAQKTHLQTDRVHDTAARLSFNSRRHLRSEEHTSELQSLMRISYAVFCLKKNKKTNIQHKKLN